MPKDLFTGMVISEETLEEEVSRTTIPTNIKHL